MIKRQGNLSMLLSLFLVSMLVSCDFLDNLNEKENDEDEDSSSINMDAYANQAQNAVAEIWEQYQDSPSGGRMNTSEPDTFDTEEVCRVMAHIDPKTVRTVLTVNFGNFRCESPFIIREGQISMELLKGSRIDEKNSIARFTYNNFKVTDLQTGKYVVYNGSREITNLSGGALPNLSYLQPDLVQKVRSFNFHIYYSGSSGDIIENTARIKHISKLTAAVNYQMVISGDTTINGIANVADWGTLRNGKDYYHIVTKPIVYSSCNRSCKYIDGVRSRKIIEGRETWTIFGVDKDGNDVSDCTSFGKLVYYYTSQGDSVANIIKYQ